MLDIGEEFRKERELYLKEIDRHRFLDDVDGLAVLSIKAHGGQFPPELHEALTCVLAHAEHVLKDFKKSGRLHQLTWWGLNRHKRVNDRLRITFGGIKYTFEVSLPIPHHPQDSQRLLDLIRKEFSSPIFRKMTHEIALLCEEHEQEAPDVATYENILGEIAREIENDGGITLPSTRFAPSHRLTPDLVD